jgi:CubicO group peptidase (beta-lactamase class C family)
LRVARHEYPTPRRRSSTATTRHDCTVRLDDPVDDLLPELADMTVLADPDGPLEDTVAATRPITLRDLLTYTLGTGKGPAEPGTIPSADALDALGKPPPNEWMRRLGSLPLVHQPGERWMYDTASDVTGVLIARATGRSFRGDALRERLCEPLGMKDTAFSVGSESIGRLATAYERDNAATGVPVVEDGHDGRWSRPPAFEGGGGGLVSTAGDFLAFAAPGSPAPDFWRPGPSYVPAPSSPGRRTGPARPAKATPA